MPYNEKFITILGELNDIMVLQGELFRAKAYSKAQETIMMFQDDINNPEQLTGLACIGPTIMSKLIEYVETGTIQAIEKERNNPMNILGKVYGIGPKKAKDLIETHGITSIAQLRSMQDKVLNDKQKIGLAYFEDIEKRIPRKEIDEYKAAMVAGAIPTGSTFEIVGSYRRGAAESGDIDVIITNTKNDPEVFIHFINALLKAKLIIEVLSRGTSKSMTIMRLRPDLPARRVDFMYSPPDEYAFSILYFTGSKVFNTVQRQRALKRGFTLNEHGIFHKVDADKVTTTAFPTEKSIFDFLEMQYKEPEERKDGRAVMDIVEPKGALKVMTENELSILIREANNAYYCNKTPIMTDNDYDILIEYTQTHYPNNTAVKEGHKGVHTPGMTLLPYQMWSMDKIKPDTDVLTKWTKKFKGPYIISCKVDGVSGLYSTEGPVAKLYTRGDGITGQDVSHIIPYLNLPSKKGITIRGEFIITKALFQSKYAKNFANPRNFVAGAINQKTIDADKYRDLSFVIYEVIHPVMKPSEQLLFLHSEKKIEMIQSIAADAVRVSALSNLLLEWRMDYKYEIDGLICMNDAIYPRPAGNPAYAFAFKMVLSDQVAEAKVVDVIWTPSKDGYLKPRVQIEPIKLGGVTIEYATGFNASFIEQNKIGLGALIKLIRSGDVIPHITDIIQPATAALMPDPTTYEWNDTHVDIVLINKEDNQVVKEKNIAGFFTHIGVDGLAGGNIKRIMAAGYDTIPKIIAMSKTELLHVEGFQEKMAQKIHFGIYQKLQETSLPELMHATNIFGRGFGIKKLASILNDLPTILHLQNYTTTDKVKMISNIPGMAQTTAAKFVDKIDEFIEFIKAAKLTDKLVPVVSTTSSHTLYKKKYVMTGFRDKELIKKLEEVGAEQASSVSKNTFMVIVNETNTATGKVDEAKKLNIPIMTPIMVMGKYFT